MLPTSENQWHVLGREKSSAIVADSNRLMILVGQINYSLLDKAEQIQLPSTTLCGGNSDPFDELAQFP